MRIFRLAASAVGLALTLAVGMAAAAPILVVFPEVDGPTLTPSGPYPQPPLAVATRTFTIPVGERVVGATMSGYWGTNALPKSTAGVDVLLDGVLVAQCVKDNPGCFTGDGGQRPWSHTFTEGELTVLDNGVASLTVVQTSEQNVRLGISTLIITTAPPPAVPTLSPAGLAGLLVALAAAGMLALRRRA
jgi:hypothetical protein